MSLAEQSQQWYPTSVQVTVLQARGLRIKGKNGTNDAYAIMQVAKEKFSTSVAEKSVAPVWKEEANFDLPLFHPSNTERCTLQVSVMHRALVGPDKMLGLAIVNLLELHDKTSRNKSEWFKLMGKTGKPDKDRGEVLIDIQFMKNNMTASMFDLSGPDKSRSRLGKFKDKLKGKKKDGMSDSASAIVPSVGQIMTDSEGEEEAEATPGTKKKSKLKSLFAPKGLHRNMSQSMSTLATLPEKDSAISLSRSSGLNVESPEGKKKFKLFKHKRTGSSDSKASQGAGSLGQGIAQGNVCINGSHVYTEDPETRESRAGSTFSLNSSGHGSMEDLRRGPNRKISTTSVDSDLQTQENALEEMHRRQEEQRKREEEIRKRLEEEKRRQIKEEEREQLRREEMRKEEERNRIEREEERRRIEREEEKRRLEKQEEERRRIEREEEKRRLEKQEEERRRIEKQEEERRRIEREEEKKRLEKQEGERRRIEREEEKRRLEKLEEERRRIEREEERKRIEKEEEMKRIEKEMKEQRKMEEEEIERKEEMVRIKREQENVSQEEERKKAEEERMREEEENRIREEMRKRMEEEDRTRIEKERMMKEEATRRIEVEKRRAEEEERLQKEKREAEEKRKRKEEEERRMTEEKERKEKERLRLEKERMELEKNEKEEMERIREEEKRKKAEQERIRQEKDELEKQKKEKEQMNIIERPEVKPRSARMNTSKRAEKADTIGSEYVLPTNPFEEALLLDENSTNLFEQSSVPQPEAPRSSSKVKPRPHAVKPLSTIDNHPDFKENQDNFTSSKIADGVQVKMKVPEAKGTPKGAGPYSQLTHEELVNLLEKQKDQLSKKDAKIVELEQYIDNLLVRVIEEKPSILMTLSSMKKSF